MNVIQELFFLCKKQKWSLVNWDPEYGLEFCSDKDGSESWVRAEFIQGSDTYNIIDAVENTLDEIPSFTLKFDV